jgi:hypothetical protein
VKAAFARAIESAPEVFSSRFSNAARPGAHAPGRLQLADALDVDDAPHGARLRGEALAITPLVHALAHAVDPAEAERFVERFLG